MKKRPNHLPPVETRFKKGQSGNPAGRPKQVFTAQVLRKRISKTLELTQQQLEHILEDKKATALDIVLASVVNRAIKDGDINKMEYLFNRSLGKVADILEATIDDDREAIRKMTTEELKAFIKKEEESAA